VRVTAIKQQAKRTNRYSVFVDGKYAFSLSEAALLESKLHAGKELTKRQIGEYERISKDDKLHNQTLRYVALRPRSKWELETYLEKKKAPPALIKSILNKLSKAGFIDDEQFARAFVNDRRLLKPTSRRRLVAELRKKRIASGIIEKVVGSDAADELAALRATIERKRRQTKYQDDKKLMQYLARQGFSYGDIKQALATEDY